MVGRAVTVRANARQEKFAHSIILIIIDFILSSVHIAVYTHQRIEKISLRIHLRFRIFSKTSTHFRFVTKSSTIEQSTLRNYDEQYDEETSGLIAQNPNRKQIAVTTFPNLPTRSAVMHYAEQLSNLQSPTLSNSTGIELNAQHSIPSDPGSEIWRPWTQMLTHCRVLRKTKTFTSACRLHSFG